jgi:hypothetical protein
MQGITCSELEDCMVLHTTVQLSAARTEENNKIQQPEQLILRRKLGTIPQANVELSKVETQQVLHIALHSVIMKA